MILDDLKATSSRNEKIEILSKYMELIENQTHCEHLKLAFDPYITFGITPPKLTSHPEKSDHCWIFLSFDTLVEHLAKRTLSGNQAKTAVQNFLERCTEDEYKFFYAILRKNLDCGVNVSTWNKVAKKVAPMFQVDIFSCQLADDGTKNEKLVYDGEKFVEVKLDGVRVITICHPDGRVNMYSRNGKELVNFTKIKESFKKSVVPELTKAMVFDGEVMSASFQDLMKQVNRKFHVQADDSVLYVFDCLSLEDFKQGKDDITLGARKIILSLFSRFFDKNYVRQVDHVAICMDTIEGRELFNTYNKQAITTGYEGLMVKDPISPYTCKRNKDWLKIKPVIEVTLSVVDLEEGTGKYENSLGGLLCRGIEDGKEIIVSVGSGLTDEMRTQIWENRNAQSPHNVLGQLIEIKADAISQNQNGNYSLRFPRFKCFRGFSPGEKL